MTPAPTCSVQHLARSSPVRLLQAPRVSGIAACIGASAWGSSFSSDSRSPSRRACSSIFSADRSTRFPGARQQSLPGDQRESGRAARERPRREPRSARGVARSKGGPLLLIVMRDGHVIGSARSSPPPSLVRFAQRRLETETAEQLPRDRSPSGVPPSARLRADCREPCRARAGRRHAIPPVHAGHF